MRGAFDYQSGIMLAIRDLTKAYPTRSDDLVVLKDVSLNVDAGKSVAIMGPSGCGKSTLLNIAGTLEPPTSGTVTIDGRDPFTLDASALAAFRNRRIGFVFQEHHLLPQCSVLENVLVPTLIAHDGDDVVGRARSLLDRVGLSDRLEHRPAELSGGERQRAAIARALIHQPKLILADEPTGNLDRKSANIVADLLTQLHQEFESALVVVTHSKSLADRFDQPFDIRDGQLQAQ